MAGGDAALPLPAAGAALLRRAAPLPALAAAGATTPSGTSAACSTSSCAACAAPRRRSSTGTPCGVFGWSPPAALVADALRPARRARSSAMTEPLRDRRTPHDRRLALAAAGLLGAFNAAGVLDAADVHVARRLGAPRRRARRARSLLAVALAVRALRARVGLPRPRRRRSPRARCRPDLPWPEPTAGSQRVGRQPRWPRAGGAARSRTALLYLDRYWREEGQVRDDLRRPARAAAARPSTRRGSTARGAGSVPGRGTTSSAPPRARRARAVDHRADRRPRHRQDHHRRRAAGPARRAGRARRPLPDRAGGADRQGRRPAAGGGRATATGRAAFAEPTATRLGRLDGHDAAPAAGLAAATAAPGSATTAATGCPHDVVVVDETSMVSLTMMARLLEAVRADCPAGAGRRPRPARLGRGRRGARRPRRRASAGRAPASPVAALRDLPPLRRRRSARLAEALRVGDADAVARRCCAPAATTSSWSTPTTPTALAARPRPAGRRARCDAAPGGRGRRRRRRARGARPAPAALRPPRGPVRRRRLEPPGRALARRADRAPIATASEWYAGRPLLVTANDYGARPLQRRHRRRRPPTATAGCARSPRARRAGARPRHHAGSPRSRPCTR